MKISERAIDQPLVMMLLSGALFILSIAAYFMLPLEAVPEVEIPFALIYVDYPGAAPNEIESQVIKPVEEQLSQLRRVDNINATAMAGRAAIFVKFLSGTDMEESIRDLKEKVSNAEKDLPDEAEDPRVIEINFEDFPMMILNLYGDFHPNRLKDIGEDLKTKLLTIPGVSGVDIFGGLDREISISFDPALLALNNISLTQAAAMIKAQNIDNPGGWVDIGQSTILVRTLGKYSLVDDIEETIVGYGESGGVIRLKDVAEVRDTFKEPDTYSRFNGKNSLTLSISKQPGYNLIDVSDEIKRKIKDISAGFPAGLKYEFTSDQSVDIRRQINQLSTNALYGIIMVILILFLVMGFRNSLIVSFAIHF
ncbi:MAG: efflux RND transporter permease subunit [Fidelibacterota bacterium]